jgi:hypothetical protein
MSQADLLSRAIKKAGSAAAIARLLGKAPPRISNYRAGREPIPDEAIAELALYLGENPIDALAAEKGGAWTRVAQAMRDKVSSGFDWLTLLVNPRRSLFSAR